MSNAAPVWKKASSLGSSLVSRMSVGPLIQLHREFRCNRTQRGKLNYICAAKRRANMFWVTVLKQIPVAAFKS
jgi:hypothetical protein